MDKKQIAFPPNESLKDSEISETKIRISDFPQETTVWLPEITEKLDLFENENSDTENYWLRKNGDGIPTTEVDPLACSNDESESFHLSSGQTLVETPTLSKVYETETSLNGLSAIAVQLPPLYKSSVLSNPVTVSSSASSSKASLIQTQPAVILRLPPSSTTLANVPLSPVILNSGPSRVNQMSNGFEQNTQHSSVLKEPEILLQIRLPSGHDPTKATSVGNFVIEVATLGFLVQPRAACKEQSSGPQSATPIFMAMGPRPSQIVFPRDNLSKTLLAKSIQDKLKVVSSEGTDPQPSNEFKGTKTEKSSPPPALNSVHSLLNGSTIKTEIDLDVLIKEEQIEGTGKDSFEASTASPNTFGSNKQPGKTNVSFQLLSRQKESRVFECEECQLQFSSMYSFRFHRSKVHSKMIDCEECGKVCKTQSSLRAHMEQDHLRLVKLICPYCNYQTKRDLYLKHHMKRKHAMIKCEQCDKVCASARELKVHTRKEHGKKSCPYCPYSSQRARNLEMHVMAKHTGEKPQACSYCDFRCVQQQVLKSHIIAKHTKEKPLSCPYCKYRCIQKSVLKSHVRARHKNTL